MMTAQERFWAKVDKGQGCWNWLAGRDKDGYGKFWNAGKDWVAHRFSYLTAHGELPRGLVIDHLCRNTSCVNPSHLEAVTQRVNVLRGETISRGNAAKTHCVNGHEFTAENTYVNADVRGCKECRRAAHRRWLSKSKAVS